MNFANLGLVQIYLQLRNTVSVADYRIRQMGNDLTAQKSTCSTILPEQRANDVVSVLGHLKQHHKYKHIVVLGGSEGGLISNLVASRVDYLSASVSFNGGGRWFLNDVIHSIRSQTKSPVNADEEVQGFKQFAKQILSGKPFDLDMSNHGYAWWHNALTIDQEDVALKIDSPVLLIQALLDTSVSPSHAAAMAKNLESFGKE